MHGCDATERIVQDFVVRDHDEARGFYDDCFSRYEKYFGVKSTQKLCTSVVDAIDSQLQQKIWELVLGVHLGNCGLCPQIGERKKIGGPDFKLDCLDRTVWIEAICPDAADRIFTSSAGENLSKLAEKTAYKITGAIKAKMEKISKYKANNIVKERDVYVIALNTHLVDPAGWWLSKGDVIPHPVEKFIFDVGDPLIDFEKKEVYYNNRGHIVNNNGKTIETNLKKYPECRSLSAILVSNGLGRPGAKIIDTLLFENPDALNAVPRALISCLDGG